MRNKNILLYATQKQSQEWFDAVTYFIEFYEYEITVESRVKGREKK